MVLNADLGKKVSQGFFVLRFYGPVNPMESCRARSVYLTTLLLGRLSPLSDCNHFMVCLSTTL